MEKQHNPAEAPVESEKPVAPKRERLTRRERRRRWKAAKKAKKNEKKEYYRYAPWGKRVWNLYLKKPVAVLLVLAILLSVTAANMSAIFSGVVVPLMQAYYQSMKNQPLTPEKEALIYKESPLDDAGAARIDALPAVGEDETWTVCVYMVGSNLEDDGENDLSLVTSMETQDEKSQLASERHDSQYDRIARFNSELGDNGLELPAFFYYPDKPVASSTVVTEDVVVSTREGCASADIREMTSGVWSDNFRVVIQTGGATRWSNQMVNPNRTQRFLYHKGQFREVANLPLQRASSPESLADFLRFCKTEYPSDHRILVLWNHGGGPFGFGHDSIYNGMFTLKDIRSALESVYTPSTRNPAFDIIGFDACLMSTLEVTETLDGFADYYCLSEEVEPGDGWDYGPWLQAMTDNPSMNPAQVARAIADSYTDYYIRQNINVPLFKLDVTFSVLDAAKTRELYHAYGELCEAQLRDAAGDIGVLAEIGRCGSRATHYAGSYYNIYNTVDLGNYADYMSDSYPEECARIRELIGESVLYHRQNGALSDSTGIAVYLPTEVKDVNGLLYYLDYVYNVSDNDAVSALYYYKQAGCLNAEMQEYVATLTDNVPKALDITPFHEYTAAEPSFDSDGFLIPVGDDLQDLMVDCQLEIGLYDEEANAITYYGRDNLVALDGEGSLRSDFDGRWIYLNSEPLYIELVSDAASAIEYRAHVSYNGEEAYLMISRNRDTDELTISGIRKVPEDGGVNYLTNTRSNEEVEPGARIAPIYQKMDYTSNIASSVRGKAVTFSARSDLQLKPLPDGYYLSTAVISDQRGDSYYSAVIGATVNRGSIGGWSADERFYGRDY